MEIIYIEENKKDFLFRWQEFIDNNITCSRYIILYLEYYLLYSESLVFDKSFVLVENNKCVGICFLPIEKINKLISVSISGGYVMSPLSVNKRVEKKIFENIDKIAECLAVQKISFSLNPLIQEQTSKFNYLTEYGFIDSSSSNCIVDLRLYKEELWKNLRKSYKALINSILKNDDYSVVIVNNKNKLGSSILHKEYVDLHEKCAGLTRSSKTFDKQFEILQNGNASIIGLKFKDKFIGINYFLHLKNTVIYASGADDPIYENSKIPIYHVILWKAILYFKENNFDFFELSRPCGFNKVNGFDDYLDEKQINISYFKRGMGSKMVPFFRGIKYINNDLFLEDIEKFKNKVANINV